MSRFLSILFLVLAYNYAGLIDGSAQDLKIPKGWKEISVCEIKFALPVNLKSQNVKGVDSCAAEYKGNKIKIGIDYGSYGSAYKNDGTKVNFKEEFTEIDGKKTQLATYKYSPNSRTITAGLYVLIYEANDGTKTSLNMTAEVESEKDLESAKQIFQNILFVKTIYFFGGYIDVFGNYEKKTSNGPDFNVEYISLIKSESKEEANLGIYSGNNPAFDPPKNAKIKKAKFGDRRISWRIWNKTKDNKIYYNYEALILDNDGTPTNHLFIGGTNQKRVQELVKAFGTYRTAKN